MTCDARWKKLFGFPRRRAETELSQSQMNMALAIQQLTEEIVLRLARTAKELTGLDNVVLSGGVALNCVANGKLLLNELFDGLWIQPAAGDAGGALGACLAAYYLDLNNKRTVDPSADSMQGAYLGPQFSSDVIERMIRRFSAKGKKYEDFGQLCGDVAERLSQGNVIGWFQGRMEYGPRALGNRSILGDPRNAEMQKKLNLKIKYREGFRPFAPSVMEEEITRYFDLDRESPYMLLVAPVVRERQNPLPDGYDELPLYDRLYYLRSDVPAITHVDYSARIQSVSKKTNPRYWQLIDEFRQKTGFGLVVNTSFNVRGEPIVCTPYDAYVCFMRTEMDYLVIGDYLFNKSEQAMRTEEKDWRLQYALD